MVDMPSFGALEWVYDSAIRARNLLGRLGASVRHAESQKIEFGVVVAIAPRARRNHKCHDLAIRHLDIVDKVGAMLVALTFYAISIGRIGGLPTTIVDSSCSRRS
jgi:hypothetical protein